MVRMAPFLPCSIGTVLALVLLSAAVTCTPQPAFAQSERNPETQLSIEPLDTVTQSLFPKTNQQRRLHDLPRLRHDPYLDTLSCRHTRDMLVRDFFDHENPDGDRPRDRVAHVHRTLIGGSGENIWSMDGPLSQHLSAEVLADTIITQWMNSPPHRKNMLREAFTHLGTCVLREGATVRATQTFARARGFLSSALPDTVIANERVPLTVQPYPSDTTTARRFDFWDPQTGRRISNVLPLINTLLIPDTSGTYRLRIHFIAEQNGRTGYRPHLGPQVTILPHSEARRTDF